MRDAVINVENLGKKYVLTHGGDSCDSLKDYAAEKLRWLLGRATPKKYVEDFWALKDVSLQVRKGETIGVIGRNGAGKSTLLKILSRITEPTIGKVTIKGRVASLLEVGTGFHPDLTGRENIFLNGAMLGMSAKEIKSKFDEIVAFAEVERFLDTPVKRYSSGMYVRLAFAVAAHLEPEILIVDEVLAVGDAQFQKKCLGKMEDVSAKEGRTIVFVSHNMSAIKSLCSRAVLLDGGGIDYSGDTFTAVNKYLMRGEDDNSVARWELEKAPSIRSACLLEVGILNDGVHNGADVSTELPIQIYIRFRVMEEAIVGTTVLLRNSEGHLVFVSISNHEPVWHGKKRPKGVYESVCEIPPNFLADGRYSVSIPLWEGFYENGLVEEDVIRFSAHEKGLVRGDLPYEMTKGIVRPLFMWRSHLIAEERDLP